MVQRNNRTTRALGEPTDQVRALLMAAAAKYGLDPNLVIAQARAESNFNQAAVSPVGAIGVMQLMPATAAWLGVDPHDVAQNIDGGVRFLSQLLKQFGGDVRKALAAYNWGPGNLNKAISRWGDGWSAHLPMETRNYITRIAGSIGDVLPPASRDTVAILIVAGLLFFLWLS